MWWIVTKNDLKEINRKLDMLMEMCVGLGKVYNGSPITELGLTFSEERQLEESLNPFVDEPLPTEMRQFFNNYLTAVAMMDLTDEHRSVLVQVLVSSREEGRTWPRLSELRERLQREVEANRDSSEKGEEA